MKMPLRIQDIAACAQLACILEASAPKPGNVNRYHDFRDTKYEHFLASGIAIGKPAENAAFLGFEAGKGGLDISDIGVGRLIRDAVFETKKWHRSNTNLGIAMLLIPLSAACGVTLARLKKMKNENVRKNLDLIIKKSTYKDSLFLYEAIRAAELGGLGRVKRLDVNVKSSDREIVKEKLNLYDIFDFSKWDSVARELITKMRISFEVGYPSIREAYSKKKDINAAILSAFLEILSRIPDSLIARKNGIKAAQEISQEARAVLETGIDAERLEKFDKKLRDKNNRLNPGTTADLVASSLMIALLNGLRL